MPIEIAGIELNRVHRIVTLEQAALVYHQIPGLEGNVAQELGRDSVRLRIEGIFYGPDAQTDLEKLRDVYKKREPVDFLADIVGQAYFGQITLERFDVFQLAAEPEQFSYVLVVTEYVKPPKPAAAAGPSAVDQAIQLDAQNFMEMATLPDGLSLGQIPELTNPAEPLGEALSQISAAAEGLPTVTEALASLNDLTVDEAPPPAPEVKPPPDEPLDWGAPPKLPPDLDSPPAIGLNGRPLGANGELLGPDGQPLLGANGELFGPDGQPLLGANGELLGLDGQPLQGPNGTLLGPDGQQLKPDGQPLLGPNGELLGVDGQPLLGPNGELLSPDGTALRGPDGNARGPDGQPIDIDRLAFAFVDEDERPLAGVRYLVTRDGDVVEEGQLDRRGRVLIKNVEVGSYAISFPDLDALDWDLSEPDKAVLAEEARQAEEARTAREADEAAAVEAVKEGVIAPPDGGVASETGWLTLELRDEAGRSVANARYLVTRADGTTQERRLDAQGQARIESLEAGTYSVTFPDLDAADWDRAEIGAPPAPEITDEGPPGPPELADKPGWLVLELRDEAGQPVANARYLVTHADGSTREGRLDAQGQARIEGLEAGTYSVTFPDLDAADWESASS